VLTPSGFVEMKNVVAGTKVIAANGKVSTVLSTSPVKKRPIYEITLDDGSKVRCSDNHLWKVQTRDDRRRKNKDGSEKYRTIELSEMLKNYKIENGKRCNYSIDYVKRIDFEEKDFLIHPYVMGVLLGDGGISQQGQIVSTADEQIIDKVNEFLPNGYCLKHKNGFDYRINGHEGKSTKCGSIITKELQKYGLQGKTSIEKFIPNDYLYCSYEQRLWLLRGLMDTDGSAKENYCVFATISKQLSNDVCELVHSLGGYVSINERKSGYKKNGEYLKCNNYYELIIQFPQVHDDIFCLERKKEKYKPKRKTLKRYITDIQYVGEEDCKCIYIDDESHLYITDNYIITHNTTLLKFFASWIIGKHYTDYSLFFSHSGDITRMFYDGVLDITTSEEYKWSEIFPDVKLRDTNAKAEKMDFGKYKPFYSLQCTSVGSKNSGKVRCNRYLYCDDLIGGIEEALNKVRLDNLWNIYSVDARQRKLNEQVKEIHIATRWSVHDVIGRLKRLYADNKRAKFIAIPDIDPITGKSNFDYEYNGMSADFFRDQALAMDDVSYRCLYKNEPIEREGLLFPEDKVRRYFNLPKEKPELITGQCDTKGKGTDYFVLPCLYKYGDDYYCVDCVCDNTADYEEQYENSANLIVHHEMNECDFERNAGGDRVAMEVNKRVEEKGWICNITDTPTESNKEARIFQCSNWILKHVIFKDKSLYTAKEQYGIMMNQLLGYSVSGKNKNDDVPDVFSNFALRMNSKERVRKTVIMQGIL
jgi:predicted phage terminase large subunit-like protein